MSKNVSFSMNTGIGGGQDIIRQMAMPLVQKSAEAVASRATRVAAGMSTNPPTFRVKTYVGLPNRRGGTRAVAEVYGEDVLNEHQDYVGRTAVQKSKDAGRV